MACLSGQKWQQARDIFEQMKAARFKPDLSTYTALLAAYHPANKWRQALQVTYCLHACPGFLCSVLCAVLSAGKCALQRASPCVLCCAVLCCAVLCCAVLCCARLGCAGSAASICSWLCCAASCCAVLWLDSSVKSCYPFLAEALNAISTSARCVSASVSRLLTVA